MSNSSALAPHVRRPVCGKCGGTGYVYLWSVDVAGSRSWFCDRSTCKRFWQEASARVASVTEPDARIHELRPVVPLSTQNQPVLQPV